MVGSCHMISTLKVTLLQLLPSSDASSTERGICSRGTSKGIWNKNPKMGTLNENLEWERGEKPPNSIKETREENRETIENILAP